MTADFTQPVAWTAVGGAEAYYLYVGSTPGAKDLINTGEVTRTSTPAASLPTGQVLYARMWTKLSGTWEYVDSTFGALTARLLPGPSGILGADLSQGLQWTAVSNAQAYYLYIGTSPGASDVINTGELQVTSYMPKSLPSNQQLYARLWTKVAGVWRYTENAFIVPVATLITPSDKSMTADLSKPFEWTAIPNAESYYLYVGRSIGAKDVVDSGELHATSYLAANLPRGEVLYARLWTRVGGHWYYRDSTFGAVIARLASPLDGATTIDLPQIFQWTGIPNAQAYYLYVGTAAGAKDVVDTGELHQTSYQTLSLPLNRTLYARLWTEIGGVWRSTDTTFGTYLATLTNPLNAVMTADLSRPLTWSSVPGASGYYLWVGTSPGTKDVVDSGLIQSTSLTATSLPRGRVLYAKLWTKVGSAWGSSSTTFGNLVATLGSPVNGTLTANLTQPFTWQAVPNAEAYYVYIGTTPGANNIVNSGELYQASFSPAPTLPRAQTLYVRLWTKIGGAWRSTDSSFGDFRARLTYPLDGSVTADLSRAFTWTPISIAQKYYLYVGTTPGGKDVVNTGEITQTTYTAHVSTNQTLYARLWTKLAGVWVYTDSSFSSLSATLVYPADGTKNTDLSRPFTWSSVPNAQAYRLSLGTTAGSADLADSGETTGTSYAVQSLPVGQILYARLQTKLADTWRFVDSTFAVQPAEPLVQPADLVYQGSFKVPHTSVLRSIAGTGFDYGGMAPAFNPANNSLFLVGHVYDQLVAELNIPVTLGTTAAAMPTATVQTPFVDVLEGHLLDVAQGQYDTTTWIDGQLVYNGKLYVNPYVYYGDTNAHAHWRRSPVLTATGTVEGGFTVGPWGTDFYTGYMAPVPAEWKLTLGGPVLMGNCCLSLLARTSLGPSVSSIDPDRYGTASITASTLVAYPDTHPTLGAYGTPGTNIYFNGSTQIRGVVFPAGTSTVLFFGHHGLGPYCYGDGDVCGDLEIGYKGEHAYPYAYYVWAYDARELAAVNAGTKQPWEVVPYAVWSLTLPTPDWRGHLLGGATYDPATGQIYVSQLYGDGDYPVVHVFKIQIH